MPQSVHHVCHSTSRWNSLHAVTLLLYCFSIPVSGHVTQLRDEPVADWPLVTNHMASSSDVSGVNAKSPLLVQTNNLLTTVGNATEIKANLPDHRINPTKSEGDWSFATLRYRSSQSEDPSVSRVRRQVTDGDGDYDYDTFDAGYSDVLLDGGANQSELQSSLPQADMSTAAASVADSRQSQRFPDNKPSGSTDAGKTIPSSTDRQQQHRTNMPPSVQQKLRPITAAAGRVLRWKLPAATFIDLESPQQLHVILVRPDADQLADAQWLSFSSETQELLALPLFENVGEHEYTLRATDSAGASVDTSLRVEVVDSDLRREKFSHQLLLTLTSTGSPHSDDSQVVWQVELISRLLFLLSSQSEFRVSVDDVVVHGMVSVPGRPHRITLSFSSLNPSPCPRRQLAALRDLLVSEEGGPSPGLSAALAAGFSVSRVQLKLVGPCLGSPPPVVGRGAAAALTTRAPAENTPPVVRRPLDAINVQVGKVLDYPLSRDLFTDVEDGGLWEMRVRLLHEPAYPDSSLTGVGNNSWFQLNAREWRLQALPTSQQLVGEHTFYLECTDSGGLSVTATVVVRVTASIAPILPALELRLHVRVLSASAVWLPSGEDGVFLTRLVARALDEKAVDSLVLVNVSGLSPVRARRHTSSLFLLSWQSELLQAPPGASPEECPAVRMRAAALRLHQLVPSAGPRGLLVEGAGAAGLGTCSHVSLPRGAAGRAALQRQHVLLSYVVPAVLMLVLVVVAALVAWQLILLQRRRRGCGPPDTPPAGSSPNGVKPLLPPDGSVQEMSRLVPSAPTRDEPATAETPMLGLRDVSV